MELEMSDILVKSKVVVFSDLEHFEEAFKDMIKQPEFIEQHKEGDRYIMDYFVDSWALLKLVLD